MRNLSAPTLPSQTATVVGTAARQCLLRARSTPVLLGVLRAIHAVSRLRCRPAQA